MKRRAYRDMIVRAVNNPADGMLEHLAARLADAERAAEMMQAKGYRNAARSLSAAVRLVPAANE